MELDIKAINRLLSDDTNLDRQFKTIEQETFEVAKRELIIQFEEHPVTLELIGGADATNISGTLGGIGNLFSFIGFPAGAQPILPIRVLLNEGLSLLNPTKRETQTGWEYRFPVNVPLIEIYEATPLPFEVGNSWVAGIEQGISGFSNFLYLATKASRSGKGIEAKESIRSAEFEPRAYLPTMLKEFINKLGGNNQAFTFNI